MLESFADFERGCLSFEIWKNQFGAETFEVDSGNVNKVDLDNMPGPDEQLDNLIGYWGDQQGRYIGEKLKRNASHLCAKLGAYSAQDVYFIAKEAIDRGWFDGRIEGGEVIGVLTFCGWEELRRIERGQATSHHAFMAMPFGNEELTYLVNAYFRPAVKDTGFTLKRLDDELHPGLIDNRLRVEIRQCKFLIADLTDKNRGAYWEAGFAEGLGKVVIYTCEKGFFINKGKAKSKGTHFDTNHHATILWEADKPEVAAEQLKATIRNAFPFEAKMPPEPEA